ncbi:MAG: hypothetical protein K8S16_06270 [Bacteroidales bacterium]|nr:hypothetical protein [Bacteroidales bacterium]
MKKIQLFLLMLILCYSGILAQSTEKSRYLKPTNFQKKVTTIVSGKSRSYYSLDFEKSSMITVRGPGKLRVMNRGRFTPEEGDKVKYEILYVVDGGEQKKIKTGSVERSKKATYMNGKLGVPGQLKDFEIELGRGDHTIEFKLGNNQIPVAARYSFTPSKEKKKEWIAFSPMQPSEPVDLISRETTVCYYRFSTEKPLKVEINGPTELRVLTRIENHYQMRGRIHYRVQVMKNDIVINTYQLSSRRSEIAVYKNDKELIPGKACEFLINVPKGRHIYEIIPLDKDKSTVLGRFLLPKKDVSLRD